MTLEGLSGSPLLLKTLHPKTQNPHPGPEVSISIPYFASARVGTKTPKTQAVDRIHMAAKVAIVLDVNHWECQLCTMSLMCSLENILMVLWRVLDLDCLQSLIPSHNLGIAGQTVFSNHEVMALVALSQSAYMYPPLLAHDP